MGTSLREAISQSGLSQRSAARKLGISQTTLSRLVNGTITPGPGVVDAYAKALNEAEGEASPLPDMRTGAAATSGNSKAKETLTLFLSPKQAETLRLMGRTLGLTRGELVMEMVAYMTAAGTPHKCVDRRARMFRSARSKP